ncbi:MAG: hypothetical protein IKW50_06885 [Oscillospiraceae bacterium]|nr:hypothetical protein [Oscillospiraceae bacterium]
MVVVLHTKISPFAFFGRKHPPKKVLSVPYAYFDQRQKSYECDLAERLAEFSWFKKFSLRRKRLSAESVKNIQKQKIPRTAVSDPSEITVRGISCFCQPLIKFSQR